MPRMIECPHCKGRGHDDGRNANWDCILMQCLGCNNSGTIPDRRSRPTANDRAVERIKAVCQDEVNGRSGCRDCENHAAEMLDIIREEQEADDA